MTPYNPRIYQVIVYGTGSKTGEVMRARVGGDAFLIGSGDQVSLKLDGPHVKSAHARLLVTTSGDVLLINLDTAETTLLDGKGIPTFKPAIWRPGIAARIGEYELQLEVLDAEVAESKADVSDSPIAAQDIEPSVPPKFVIDWGGANGLDVDDTAKEAGGDVPLPKGTVQFTEAEILADDMPVQGTVPFTEEEILGDVASDRPSVEFTDEQLLEDSQVETRPHSLQHEERQWADPATRGELARTPDAPFDFDPNAVLSPPATSSVRPPFNHTQVKVGDTLPKDWQQVGHLSGQLTINPVNLVAGERVRVPVSVRNGYDHPVQLRIYVAGLSRDEVILPPMPLVFEPGEVRGFDLILRTAPPPPGPSLEALVRLRDPSAPDIVVTLTLHLIFKDAPNVTGHLEPQVISHNKPAYLYLQNHTQARMTVFVAGHSEVPGTHIIPNQTEIDIPSGQIAKVPIRVDVSERPLFRRKSHAFAVSARQGTRAPLDFPGTVHVRSRFPAAVAIGSIIMVMVALAVGIGVLAARPGEQAATAAPATSVIESTAESADSGPTGETTTLPAVAGTSSVPSSTSAPTLTRENTNTPTVTSTFTVTPEPTTSEPTAPVFDDPRPAGCAVPIPSGWKPYIVQAGDRVFRLAIDNGTTVDEVAAVNCLADPRMLQVGQVLLLPIP